MNRPRNAGARRNVRQGEAVAKALDTDRNTDLDRWDDFSEKKTRQLAADPGPPEGATRPLAGLARDGGLVEGEDAPDQS